MNQPAEKLEPEGGGGFNPRINPTEIIAGFSPGGSFSAFSLAVLLSCNLLMPHSLFQYREGCQPTTITIAPTVISAPPTSADAFSFSPSSSHANTITSGTLSLSSGATRDAGPNCSARK
jgi:hypothetical protein